MGNRHIYTPEEATQLYLDLLKGTNPSPAVQEVIDKIEGERELVPPDSQSGRGHK